MKLNKYFAVVAVSAAIAVALFVKPVTSRAADVTADANTQVKMDYGNVTYTTVSSGVIQYTDSTSGNKVLLDATDIHKLAKLSNTLYTQESAMK
jgi:hypothetical protein